MRVWPLRDRPLVIMGALLVLAGCGGAGAGIGSNPSATVSTVEPTPTASPSTQATATTEITTSTPAGASQTTALNLGWIGMRNASMGWAVSASDARSTALARLLRTDDGGITWRDVSPGPLADPAPVVAFTDEHVWVAADGTDAVTVWRSGDGGSTWERTDIRLDPPFEASRLVFPDREHGWLLIQRGGAAGTVFVDFYRTADGGETWSRMASPPADDHDAALQTGHNLDLDANPMGRVWVTKDFSALQGAHIAVSVDGGATWGDVTVRGVETGVCSTRSPWVRDVAAGKILVVCDNGAAWAASTPDNGLNWDLVVLPEEASQAFWFEGRAFAWGDALLRGDHDGWEVVHRFAPRPASVSIPDAEHVFAVVDNTLLVSSDQGSTWKEITPTIGE